MKRGLIILIVMFALLGCSTGRNENPKAVLEDFKVGETVYVCGCPMMCCNSISKIPNGKCSCNFPLRPGIVSRIQNGKVYVKVAGREKFFFVPSR